MVVGDAEMVDLVALAAPAVNLTDVWLRLGSPLTVIVIVAVPT
jgi:hypothetical protein